MHLECPKSKRHKRFAVTAHVTEEWIVDPYGDFLKIGGIGDVTHRPDVESDNFYFTCATCGADAVRVKD
jgi:hypothetical protein